MVEQNTADRGSSPDTPPRRQSWWRTELREFFSLRRPTPAWQSVVFGLLCLATVLGIWWFVTAGDPDEPEQRIVSAASLPSPKETLDTFHSLWFDRGLTRNTMLSLRRVTLGFALAAAVGVPLGVLCGCFSWISAFFAPLSIFGRNIPIAALIPVTFLLFGIGETQKTMFIFIACVAFVLTDTARAVSDVGEQYVDTAYTLGANRWQTILKVLVPLALPSVFNSLRLLFGLAFGYIMLAELVKIGGESGGLGDIILTSQRRGITGHIILVLLIIPVVALVIDRLLFWIQRELFPYRYGGRGVLNSAVRGTLHGWEDLKSLVIRPARAAGTAGESASSVPTAPPPAAPAVTSEKP
ncbi:MAG: ABC transporter permease [Planctomycetia bacterium]|nr:ABC transporter permease [Planctomycetia bacterium]